MAGTLFSCMAKSHDGGQSFYEFRQMEYGHLGDRLVFDNNCVKVTDVPTGPIIEVWGMIAADSREMAAYARVHGKSTQYSGLKPRWMVVNLRPHNVWSNFSVSNDLILEKVILSRGLPDDECMMIVNRSFGGICVDYNLFPVKKNNTSGIVSNWSWWKSIQFIIHVWLLSQKEDAVVVCQVLLDYGDPERPDRPTHFTYAVRFVAKENEQKTFLATCFQNVMNHCRDQPADYLQFYNYALESMYSSKILEKMKRLTWERLHLEDKEKDGIVQPKLALTDGSVASVKEQIAAKWIALQAVAEEVEEKAAASVAKFIDKNASVECRKISSSIADLVLSCDDADSYISDAPSKGDTASINSDAASIVSLPLSTAHDKKLVITGMFFDRKNIKNGIEDFFKSSLELDLKIVKAEQISRDKFGYPIICVVFHNVADRNKVLAKNKMLRNLGSCVYFNEYRGNRGTYGRAKVNLLPKKLIKKAES